MIPGGVADMMCTVCSHVQANRPLQYVMAHGCSSQLNFSTARKQLVSTPIKDDLTNAGYEHML